ncbi:MAG: RNA polymerase sigma factor [Desulfobacteraceae bacterium]|jgi:RNA polymerase sigma-70 factor (ECF subfamily)|nr:MAG: RNA polymerase sigma factor [Desulfobacteraceae bacterium]
MTETPGDTSDATIIDRVLGGDTNAFEHLVTKYRAHVFRIVGRHVPAGCVEETAQDTFIRIYRGLAGFSRRSGFKQWLTAIAIRASYDCLRRVYRSRETPFTDLAKNGETDYANIVADYSRSRHVENHRTAALRELLDTGMAQLKPPEKMVLELVYFEGFSHGEAAELLGWSVANVKIRSYRGRKKLNTILKKIM